MRKFVIISVIMVLFSSIAFAQDQHLQELRGAVDKALQTLEKEAGKPSQNEDITIQRADDGVCDVKTAGGGWECLTCYEISGNYCSGICRTIGRTDTITDCSTKFRLPPCSIDKCYKRYGALGNGKGN